MAKPYLDADEIYALMTTFPFYAYFPKSEWKDIQRAEIKDEIGVDVFNRYAEIYRRDFFGSTQDDKKVFLNAIHMD